MDQLQIASASRTRHLPHLDGLRACLALYVVLDHICITIWPAGHVSGVAWIFSAALATVTTGRVAVNWFIVLSGFCLMLPTLSRDFRLRRGAVDFYLRRARRILPTYWIAVALSVAMCLTVVGKKTGTHWDITLPVTWRAVASAALLTNDLIDPIRINHVFWSIAVEWRIYFLFPLLLWLWRQVGGRMATLLVAGGMIATSFALPHLSMQLLFLQTTLSFTGLFAMGAFAAYLSFGVDYGDAAGFKRGLLVVAPILALLAVASLSHVLPRRLCCEPINDALVGLTAATCLVMWSMPGASSVRLALSWSPLAKIGLFAFSLYLVHAPIVQLCWQVFVRPSGLQGAAALGVLLPVAMPISVLCAFLFFLAFERPFLSSRQREAAAPLIAPVDLPTEIEPEVSVS